MKLNNNIFLTLAFLMASLMVKAQTIEYSYEPLSTTSCNIFANATTVDNYEHLTSLSRPKFNDEAVVLECKTNNSTSFLASIYSINYGFKAGYNYKISVYYKGDKDVSDGYYPRVGLKISTTNGGTDAGTNCVGPSSYLIADASDFDMSISNSSYAWKTNLIDVTLAQNADYLLVGAFPYVGTAQPANIFIRKIQIVETAPPVSFTLAPATLNIACGSSTPQTFTVTNVHSTPGVTAHNWDLGSANNGWLYNGSAAPQYISTGTTNTLTLTPVCGSVQQSVNVSVTANGNAYPANASVVSVTIPTFTIQGSQTLCSGTQSYSIPDLPCNATVSWQSSNTNIATITASGNPATLTRVNNSNGVVTITATINTCGSNQVVPYQVGVGKAQPGTVNILLFDPYMGKILAEIDPVPGATSYKWYKNGVVQPGRVGTFANIGISETPCNINYNIAVEAVSSCGTSAASSANVFYSCDYLFTISPNPAQSMVSVSVKETKKIQDGSGVIDEIRIYDSYGGLQKRLQHFGTKRADFNISGIPSGRYLIEIRSGKYKEYQQLIIQK